MLVAAVTFGCLFGLALLAGEKLGPLMINSVDQELRTTLASAQAGVVAGQPVASSPEGTSTAGSGITIRVLDTAGGPVDGSPRPALSGSAIRELKAGMPVGTGAPAGPRWRWLAAVVSAPDGQQRLILAGAPLIGFAAAVERGTFWLLLAASLGALVSALATWLVVHAALRPVAKMRGSVRALPPGERLAPSDSDDELRELAAGFNALLDRHEEATERLRRFTGDAAHELRSPVASIRVQAEVAVTNPDTELASETLADILAESERLSSLLDGLLTLARSDAGELPSAEPVELVSEARAALARLPSGSPQGRVSGVVGQAWAHAAHSEVELVLNNLLRNACHYARSQIVVSVQARRSTVRVIVDDDGPGISAEHRGRVFDRFYRVADDRARASGGAGLGLAMVAETVRRRGGQVLVGESPEGGARFQVTWRARE